MATADEGPSADPDSAFRLLDRVGVINSVLWDRATRASYKKDDPRAVAVWLMVRLKDHRDAFAVLWSASLWRDAATIERSAIEATLSLAWLRENSAAFLSALESDAASTLSGQIPIWRAVDGELADDAAARHEQIFGGRGADGKRHARLAWQSVAQAAGYPSLYRRYRHLSAQVVHVTGLSIATDLAILAGQANSERLASVEYIALSTIVGAGAFAQIMGYDELIPQLNELLADIGRMAQPTQR